MTEEPRLWCVRESGSGSREEASHPKRLALRGDGEPRHSRDGAA